VADAYSNFVDEILSFEVIISITVISGDFQSQISLCVNYVYCGFWWPFGGFVHLPHWYVTWFI